MTRDAVSPYEVLGVPVGATVEEIRRAYVRLARRHHPDYHVGESDEARAHAGQRMRELNEAWAALSDPAVRRSYERELATRFRPLHPEADDEPDPRDMPDVAYRSSGPPTRVEQVARILTAMLFVFAGLTASVGLVTSQGLVAVAVVSFVFSCVGMLVVALLVLGRAARDEG